MAVAGDDERFGHLETNRSAVAATREREAIHPRSAFLGVAAGHWKEQYAAALDGVSGGRPRGPPA
jgi:hypothetical protein